MNRISYMGMGLHLVDENDNPIVRTPDEHPYSYDGYIVQRLGKNEEITDTAYSDRLRQENSEKYSSLSIKHFGKTGEFWSHRSAAEIQSFLREFLNAPNLKLIFVMQYCHQSAGYPYWRFDYNRG